MIRRYIEKRKLSREFPDGVDMVANALKAGLSLQQALLLVSKEGPSTIAGEFKGIIKMINDGEQLDDALIKWRDDKNNDDITIFAESILVLRRTGGNLIETFSEMSKIIRERKIIEGKIRVLVSQGVMQAVTITLMPFLLMLGLYFTAEWYVRPLYTTGTGIVLLASAIILQAAGVLLIRKIIKIDV